MLEPSLTGWRAQYDRMQRSYARVTGAYTSSVAYDDDLHHFMQDCWHLKDWIENDSQVLAGIRKSIEKKVLAYHSLEITADLALASKHLERTRTRPNGAYVTSTNVTVHLGQDRPADIEYEITLEDCTTLSAHSLVRQAVTDWDELLRKLKLLP